MIRLLSIFLLLNITIGSATCPENIVANTSLAVFDRLNNVHTFLRYPIDSLVNSIKQFPHYRRIDALKIYLRIPFLDKSGVDQKIFKIIDECIAQNVITVEEAYKLIKSLERPHVIELFSKQDSQVGRWLMGLTPSGLTIEELIKKNFIKDTELFLRAFRSQNLTPEEIEKIVLKISKYKVDITRLENYLEYLSILRSDVRARAVQDASEVFTSGPVESQVIKEFFYNEFRVEKYQSKFLKKYGVKSLGELPPNVEEKIFGKINLYRTLGYACIAEGYNKYNSTLMPALVYGVIVTSIIQRVYTLLETYSDRDVGFKTRAAIWEIVMSIVLGRISANIKGSNESFLYKVFKDAAVFRSLDSVFLSDVLVKGGLYGVLVDGKEVLHSDEVLRFLRNPKNAKKIQEIENFIEKEKLVEKVQANLSDSLIHEYKETGKVKILEKFKAQEGINSDQEALIELVKYSILEQAEAEKIRKNNEFFKFNIWYSPLAAGQSFIANVFIAKALCVFYGKNPLLRYGIGIGLTLVNRQIMNQAYFGLRKFFADEK